MTFLVILFGLLGDCLVAALVGVLGSRRRIGFGWSFFLSVLFTPLVGLVITLLSDRLDGGERRWGCLGTLLGLLAIVMLFWIGVMLLGGLVALAAA